jgi:GNAT superfamily N-acetyltransferase
MTMSDDPTIRTATAADADALAPLMTQLGYPTEPAAMRARLERIDARPGYRTVVAERDGRIVGTAGMLLGIGWNDDHPWARVMSLVVTESERGRGTGAALLRAAEEWARENGADSLHLTASRHREGAHRFYERMGYEATGLRFVRRLV